MSTYVVGDVQGCLEPLKCLLDSVQFEPHKDTLWSVGDIVNRGPQCLQTLRFFHELRDSVVLVLGNHDLHLLATAAGVRPPGRGDTFEQILSAPDRDELLYWLRHRPLIHHEHSHTLVHAGIPPQWSLEDAIGYAREVEVVLQSEDYLAFFTAMYGNEPPLWTGELRGLTRLRVITNYLTRMRYCTADGALDLHNKGPAPAADASHIDGKKVAAWFSHPGRKTKDNKILFGHWASLQGRTDTPNAIALDTGCVWDGFLSLYELESQSWSRCDCHRGGIKS